MLIVCHISATVPDGEYPEDPTTVPTAQRSATTIFGKLIDRYGTPVEIYTSPYEAGRKTCEFIKNVVDRRGVCSYNIDPRLGPRIPPLSRLRPETIRFSPISGEDAIKFGTRVTDVIARYRNLAEGKVIWIVTHSDVMLLAHKIIKETPPERIDYHCYLTMEDSRAASSVSPIQIESRVIPEIEVRSPVKTPKAEPKRSSKSHGRRPEKYNVKPKSSRRTRFEESSNSSDEDFYDTLEVDPSELRKRRMQEKDPYAIQPPRPNLPRFATQAMVEAATRPFIDESDNEDWTTLPE